MISIKLLRENPEIVKDSQHKRGFETKIVDEVLAKDKEWRSLLQENEKLKAQRNKTNDEIILLKKAKKNAEPKINECRKISEHIKKNDLAVEMLQKERDELLLKIPNILHDSVPQGKDNTESVEIRKFGKTPKFDFKPKDHIDLGLALGLIDIERAAKTSGARFYFLKNEAVQLEFALIQYVLETLAKEGFTPIIPPVLVKGDVMFGVGMLPHSKDEIYKIENSDLYLILTAEHAICGYYMNEILEKKSLPKKFLGFSSCFRTEAGSHGKDTKGIFRVHQFDKLEMFVFCTPETSWEEHEKLITNAEKLVKGLELPYRVMNICTGDIGNVAAKKYDVEVWFPGQDKYREIISCSNCTDFQARRLNIRYAEKAGMKPEFLHTLNSTALAIGRTLVAILENYQKKDGSVEIPKVLQKYTGFKKIKCK